MNCSEGITLSLIVADGAVYSFVPSIQAKMDTTLYVKFKTLRHTWKRLGIGRGETN